MNEAKLLSLIEAFENLAPDTVERLVECYAEEAAFKDPFNEVSGRAAIAAIFRHMFVQLDAPRFRVISRVCGTQEAMLTWEFDFRFRGEQATRHIRGASHLVFDAQGAVRLHRDYWDAAEELYEKLPLIGSLMRLLRRRLATPL